DGTSADGSNAPRGTGRQTAPGSGGARGLNEEAANDQRGGSASGGTASVIRGGARPHGGTVGTGWGMGNQHGSGSIEGNGSVKPAEVPFEGALNSGRNRDTAMHGGTTEQRVVRTLDTEPNSDEAAQTKDDVTGEDGMVLKVGVDKNTQGQAQDAGPKPVV